MIGSLSLLSPLPGVGPLVTRAEAAAAAEVGKADAQRRPTTDAIDGTS